MRKITGILVVTIACSPAITAVIVVLLTVAPAMAQVAHNTVILGDLAASIIEWAIAAFGPVLAAAVLWLVIRLLKAAGIKNTDLLKDQLQRIIVNGLNAGAAKAEQELRGRGQVDVKGAAAEFAVQYAQQHGAEIIRALGLDPASSEAVQAIKARIETAIADPATPTAVAVTPQVVALKSTPTPAGVR